jgi:hypothetical protein
LGISGKILEYTSCFYNASVIYSVQWILANTQSRD